jgi:hypothetical protein
MKRVLPALALLALACNTAGPMSNDWRVAIATDGGFTGRGIGGVTIEGAANHDAALARAVAGARPEQWKREYLKPGNPHGYADQVHYTLTLTRDGRASTTSWYDDAREQLPPDLSVLFDRAWSSGTKKTPAG